jgi:hypothetical protein
VNRCRVHRAHRAPPGPTPRKIDCEIPHLQLPHSVIRSNQCYRGSEHADSFFLFFSAVEFGIFSGLIATIVTCQSQPSIPSLIKAHQRTQRTFTRSREFGEPCNSTRTPTARSSFQISKVVAHASSTRPMPRIAAGRSTCGRFEGR